MAKRGRHPHHRRRQARPGRGPGPDDLLSAVAQRLASGEPLDFLDYVSSLLTAVDPRGQNPFEPERSGGPEGPTLSGLLESFTEIVLPETTALLAALAELGPDELTRARARRALAARPPGYELTAVIYIDHNLGTIVKDAFTVPGSIGEVSERLREIADDPDVRLADISLADARVRAAEAIQVGAIMFPPAETETWPASRPLTEWLLRLLPEGGTGYVRPKWSEPAKKKLAKRFFGAPFGQPLDDADHRDLLDQILWFGTDYGPGDPLRWSPVAVEILLADWIPRKIMASPEYLSAAPALLRAFIRFCHAERKIRPALTDETLAAVDEQEPEYQRGIRSPRPQGPMALLAAMGVLDDEKPWEDEPVEREQGFLEALAEEVGGQESLDALDDRPLPDEEFAW